MNAARAGLWALPTYGVLLGLSTVTHQPSIDDFDAYARYITTDVFLVSHLGASIFGAALAILGAVAVTAYLKRSRLAVTGVVLTTVANVFMAAAFGSSTFVQPGIGRAHLAGAPGMPALNDDTAYGTAFVTTALSASALLVIAAIVLGVAIARSDHRLRWWGIAYAALIPLFTISGFALQPLQPIAGLALAAATAGLAIHLPRTAPTPVPA